MMTDDQGYGDIASHGNPVIQTPRMDELAAQSIRLTDFHVDPTCSPTRSALLTGRYSTRTGVWHTIMGRSLMKTEEVTLAEVFRDGGYRTGMVGKWHLGDNYPNRPQDQGFEEAFYHGSGGVGQGADYWDNDYFDDTYYRNGVPEKAAGYVTDVWFENALAFIERHKDDPFFLYLATNAPHGPYYVEEKYAAPYREKGVPDTMARFYGMITNLDENLGRLLTRLDGWDLTENTILIFMTDNGSAEGWDNWRKEPGSWAGFNSRMRDGKGSEYDGGHRVPFFIRWPKGGLTGGRDVHELTAHIDVLPTLLELCNLEPPRDVSLDGVSLAPLLRGQGKTPGDRVLFVHSQRVPYPIKWRKSSVMTKQWRLINGEELYDVLSDPGQKLDIAAEHPQVVERLRTFYEDWWTSLSPVFDDYVRIIVGSNAENPSHLNPHDWHVSEYSQSVWNHRQVREGQPGNGFWAVEVQQPGEYEFELRRWPAHVDSPIEATRARLQIGDLELEKELSPNETKATFRARLEPGPTQIQTWLTSSDGKTQGAYFVYVERLK
jgi:arylsulfatase A-like enzyme